MKRSIFQIVGLLLLLPLFSGCNDSDDVAAIFTGKTWKLAYITLKDGKSMSGSWNANGKKSTFKISNLDAGSDGDVLAKEFIAGLQGADSFKGSDERNLFLYYSSGNQTRCLVFAPSKN